MCVEYMLERDMCFEHMLEREMGLHVEKKRCAHSLRRDMCLHAGKRHVLCVLVEKRDGFVY